MEPQAAVKKPQPVTTAVKLLWTSFALGLIKLPMDLSSLNSAAPTPYVYFVMFFTFIVIGYLIYRISAGENWARITFLAMLIIGLLPSLPQISGEFSRAPLSATLLLTQIGLQAYALILLFTQPGSGWFNKAKAE